MPSRRSDCRRYARVASTSVNRLHGHQPRAFARSLEAPALTPALMLAAQHAARLVELVDTARAEVLSERVERACRRCSGPTARTAHMRSAR